MRAVRQFVVVTSGAVEFLGLTAGLESDLENGGHESYLSLGVNLAVCRDGIARIYRTGTLA